MKSKITRNIFTIGTIGFALALSSCSQKEVKPSDDSLSRVSPAKPGQIGSTESSQGRSPIETDVPSVTEKRIQADINRMSSQDFEQLGLTADAAQKVIAYRNEHGNFKSVDELRNVSGMDNTWLSRMQDRLAVS